MSDVSTSASVSASSVTGGPCSPPAVVDVVDDDNVVTTGNELINR